MLWLSATGAPAAVVSLPFCPFDVIAGFLSNRGLLVPGELVSLIAPHC